MINVNVHQSEEGRRVVAETQRQYSDRTFASVVARLWKIEDNDIIDHEFDFVLKTIFYVDDCYAVEYGYRISNPINPTREHIKQILARNGRRR